MRGLVLVAASLAAGPVSALDVRAVKPRVEATVAADYPHLLALCSRCRAGGALTVAITGTWPITGT
ncbi:MAG: hypothetical protein ABIO86_14525 [Sphingomonas sp.]